MHSVQSAVMADVEMQHEKRTARDFTRQGMWALAVVQSPSLFWSRDCCMMVMVEGSLALKTCDKCRRITDIRRSDSCADLLLGIRVFKPRLCGCTTTWNNFSHVSIFYVVTLDTMLACIHVNWPPG
jgi:hypothetical protein